MTIAILIVLGLILLFSIDSGTATATSNPTITTQGVGTVSTRGVTTEVTSRRDNSTLSNSASVYGADLRRPATENQTSPVTNQVSSDRVSSVTTNNVVKEVIPPPRTDTGNRRETTPIAPSSSNSDSVSQTGSRRPVKQSTSTISRG